MSTTIIGIDAGITGTGIVILSDKLVLAHLTMKPLMNAREASFGERLHDLSQSFRSWLKQVPTTLTGFDYAVVFEVAPAMDTRHTRETTAKYYQVVGALRLVACEEKGAHRTHDCRPDNKRKDVRKGDMAILYPDAAAKTLTGHEWDALAIAHRWRKLREEGKA